MNCVILNTLCDDKKKTKKKQNVQKLQNQYSIFMYRTIVVAFYVENASLIFLECLGARARSLLFPVKTWQSLVLNVDEKKKIKKKRKRKKDTFLFFTPPLPPSSNSFFLPLFSVKRFVYYLIENWLKTAYPRFHATTGTRGFNVALTFPLRLVLRVFCEARALHQTISFLSFSFAFFPAEYNFLLIRHEFPYSQSSLPTRSTTTTYSKSQYLSVFSASKTWQK